MLVGKLSTTIAKVASGRFSGDENRFADIASQQAEVFRSPA
jgi:hypothetical protein